MNVLATLKNNQLVTEYNKNKRLQWMILGIAVIIIMSAIKSIADDLSEYRLDAKSQIELLARLNHSAKENVNMQAFEETAKQAEQKMLKFSSVASASVAEAQGLKDIDEKIGGILKRKRLNLIGSEELKFGGRIFWSVRIEISGQLAESDFIQMASFFDNTQLTARIASMQYSPKTSNSISLVVDLIFKRASDA
jgi:hypothetical protein